MGETINLGRGNIILKFLRMGRARQIQKYSTNPIFFSIGNKKV